MFKLDKSFLKELHKRLVKEHREPFGIKIDDFLEDSEAIPSLLDLEEIISLTFWASTKFEEGRQLKFRVNYALPFDVQHVSLTFNLNSIKTLSVEELRKLAPAVVPPNGQICVFPWYGKLRILGLQTDCFTGVTFEMVD